MPCTTSSQGKVIYWAASEWNAQQLTEAHMVARFNANPRGSTVMLGASRKSQLQGDLRAPDSSEKRTPDVMARIDEILGNKPEAHRALAR